MIAGPRERQLVAAILRLLIAYAGHPLDRSVVVRMLTAPGAPLAKFAAEDFAPAGVDLSTLVV
jgi:hypothetical protein